MDIRNPRLRERKIKMIYPRFIFHPCKVCGYEFKKTSMWAWIDDWYDSDRVWAYACFSCVPEYKDLFQYIYGYIELEAKPDAGKGE